MGGRARRVEADLPEMIQTQLIKVKRRNASLQFT